jgi:hypothetical protein
MRNLFSWVAVAQFPLLVLSAPLPDAPEKAKIIWDSLWFFALFCVLFSSTIAGIHINSHLKYNPNPKIKKVLVRIFLLIPLYALESLLAMTFEHYAVLLETARDCYEVFVIFSFFQFMVEYLGGERRLILALEPKKHVFPFCCWPTWKPAQNFLSKSKAGALQYVFVRVLCSMFEFWFLLAGTDAPDDYSLTSPNLWIVLAVNFSQMWAIYCLVLFYMAMKHKLKPINPIAKMLCIKGLVFFTWWQSVGIDMAQSLGFLHTPVLWYGEQVSKAMQDFLICVEMVFAAFAFRWAFPYTDFVTKEDRGAAQPVFRSLLTAANVVDVIQEVPIGKPEYKGPELKAEFAVHREDMSFAGEELGMDAGEDRIAVRVEEYGGEHVLPVISVWRSKGKGKGKGRHKDGAVLPPDSED